MGEISRLLQSSYTESATSSSRAEEETFMRWTDESVKLPISLYHEHEHKFADVNYRKKKCVRRDSPRHGGEKLSHKKARSAQISGNS